MITINEDTKIAALLKASPDALEAIISISPKFTKLRNPLLRKVMAIRTSILTASKVSGTKPEDFFQKLEPLGFIVDRSSKNGSADSEALSVPGFVHNLDPEKTHTLDVRPIMENGGDPFSTITREVKKLPVGHVLELINTFEPVPLIDILKKQGFQYFVDKQSADMVTTYFYKPSETKEIEKPETGDSEDWEQVFDRYKDNLVNVDVRQLEMPQPMLTILAALEDLKPEQALFVLHKRIPVFLLPELQDRKFDYRINEIAENQVHLLIFKA